MAIKDAVVTLKGADAKVRKVEIFLDERGKLQIVVFGETKDSTGRAVSLEPHASIHDAGTLKWADEAMTAGLPLLRQKNGLE